MCLVLKVLAVGEPNPGLQWDKLVRQPLYWQRCWFSVHFPLLLRSVFSLVFFFLNWKIVVLSLDRRNIPKLKESLPKSEKFGICIKFSVFWSFKYFRRENWNFQKVSVLEVVVDGKRLGKLWFFVLQAGAQNGRVLVLFKGMTKYGKPSAKEHQIWWSVKKRQKWRKVCRSGSNKIKTPRAGGNK